MKDILQVSLIEAFQKYAGKHQGDFSNDGGHRYKTLCHAHKDTAPSLKIYDKTSTGQGWDFHCFVCGASGNVVDLVMDMSLADSKEDAIRMIRKDFNMEFPAKVTLDFFCRMKGLDLQFCQDNGFVETERGVKIACLDQNHEVAYSKVRVKYEGKDKYYFSSGNSTTYDIPFGFHWLSAYDRKKPLYIVEGETDAVTLKQAGYQAIGYPSANSFGNVDCSYLADFDKVIIPRDNDPAGLMFVKNVKEQKQEGLYTINFFGAIKDVNDFHVYKANGNIAQFKAEFDQLPVYAVSYETLVPIVKENPSVLKDMNVLYNIGLYIDNEIERDMMVDAISKASKISKATIKSGIEKAYRETKKKLADSIVSTDLIVRENCYYRIKTNEGIPTETMISNFIIRPTKVLDRDGDIVRVLTLVNSRGQSAQNIMYSAEELTIPIKFSTKCMNAGDFLFKGSQEDLQAIAEMIFSKELQSVKSPSMVGRTDEGRWIFRNFGVDKDGTIIEINEEGVIEFDNERYLPKSLYVGDDDASVDIPDLPHELPEPSDAEINDFIADLRISFGTDGVYMGLGWLIAGLNSHHIFSQHRMFPYLMTIGKRGSGKSTFAGLVYELAGFGQHKISSIDSPTQVGMLRTMKYMSSLPIVYDDYRNTAKIKYKDNLLLDVYNRHGGNKGTLQANVVRQEKIRAFVMLSGEDVPSNNALRTRCVEVHISANQGDRSMDKLHKLQAKLPKMQRHILSLIQKYQSQAEVDDMISVINRMAETLESVVGDQRYALNASIFAGAFIHAFGKHLSADELTRFNQYITSTSRADKKSSDDEHSETLFFKDIIDMVSKGTIGQELVCIKDDKLLIRMRPVHKEWSKYLKQTDTADDTIGEYTLRKYFSKEDFYEEERRVRTEWGNHRYIIIDLPKFTIYNAGLAEELIDLFAELSEDEDTEF